MKRLLAGLVLTATLLPACGPEDSPPAATPTAPPASTTPAATAPPSTVPVEVGACGAYSQTDNALSNGDFEAPTAADRQEVMPAGKQFTNWKVDSGNITLFAMGFTPPSGSQAIGFAGSLSQTISSFPGKQYVLTFCYATAPGASSGGLAVSWNGQGIATLPLDAATPIPAWKGVKITLPAAGAFQSTLTLNGQSALLDTIKLTLVP